MAVDRNVLTEARRWWGKPKDGVYTRAEGGYTWTLRPIQGGVGGRRWFLNAPGASLVNIAYAGGQCATFADAKDAVLRFLSERELTAAQYQAHANEKAAALAYVAKYGEHALVARLAALAQERDESLATLTRLTTEWGSLHQTLQLAGVKS